MPPIAFFDVDKTIVKGYTGFFTTLDLIRKGILKKRRLPLALFYRLSGPFLYGDKEAPLEKMYQIAINDMAGSHIDDILKIGRDCFERWIKPRIYHEAIDHVREHQQKGHGTYLITSGPYMVIRILADFLQVDGFYSAGPVIDSKGVLTRELRKPIYYREGKLAAAEEVLKERKVAWQDCYFYSDSMDDIPLLQKVGHPRLVNPDSRLSEAGRKNNWPILNFSRLLNGKEKGET